MGWWWIAPAHRRYHWFHEGASADMLSSVYLALAGVLAWTAWTLAKGTGRRTLWMLCALGMLFFAADERFGLHERAHEDFLLDAIGMPPVGRNWNDIIVLGYGVAALIVLAWQTPAFVRFRRTRNLLIAAFGFYALHTGIDVLVEHTPDKMIYEETAKVLAGASFVAAFLHAVLSENHERAARGEGEPVPRASHGFTLVLCAVAIAVAVLVGDRDYQRWLRNHWGSTHSWVVAVCWMGSAILLFAAWLHGPRKAFWPAAAAFTWIVGVGESWRATRGKFRHDEMHDVFPSTIRTDVDAMHDPLELEGYLFLAVLAVLLLWGVRATVRFKGIADWFLAAAFLSAASLAMNVLLEEWGNDVGAPLLRIVGGACLLFGSLVVLVTSGRSVAGGPSRPS